MTQFDRTTRPDIDPGERLTGKIELDAGWSSLRGLHGGYLAAISVRFAEAHLVGQDVRTILTSFLRPATVGPAQLSITTERVSRGLTTHQVDLGQGDRPVAITRITATTAAVAHAPKIPSSAGKRTPLPSCHRQSRAFRFLRRPTSDISIRRSRSSIRRMSPSPRVPRLASRGTSDRSNPRPSTPHG